MRCVSQDTIRDEITLVKDRQCIGMGFFPNVAQGSVLDMLKGVPNFAKSLRDLRRKTD